MKGLMKLNKDKKLCIDKKVMKYIHKCEPGQIFNVEIKKNKNMRSYTQHRLYWITMNWLSYNMPEAILNALNLDKIDQTFCHELAKVSQNISSTSFDNMGQNDFQEYFNNVQDWIAIKLLHCTKDDLLDAIAEHRDVIK